MWTVSPLLSTTSSADAAFYVVFAVFVVAILTLVVIVIVWAVRHDLAGREAWRARARRRASAATRRGESP